MSKEIRNNTWRKVTPVGDSWIVCKSKSHPGHVYYFNSLTGETAWNLSPAEIEKAKSRTKHLERLPGTKPTKCPEPKDKPPSNTVYNLEQPQTLSPEQFVVNRNSEQQASVLTYTNIPNSNAAYHSPFNQTSGVQLDTQINNPSIEPFCNFSSLSNSLSAYHLNAPTVYNPTVWAVPHTQQVFIAPVNNNPGPQNVAYHNLTQALPRAATGLVFDNFENTNQSAINTSGMRTFYPREFNHDQGVKRPINKYNGFLNKHDLRQKLSFKKRFDIQSSNPGGSVLPKASPRKGDDAAHIANKFEGTHSIDSSTRVDRTGLDTQVHETSSKIDLGPLKSLAPSGSNSDAWFLVVDLEVLLHEFKFLTTLTDSDDKCHLMVPKRVMEELKSYVSCTENIQAKRILRFLSQQIEIGYAYMSEEPSKVEGDGMAAVIHATCAELLNKNYHLILLTNDNELLSKGPSNINMFSIDEIKNFLMGKLNKKVVSSDPKKLFMTDELINKIKITVPNDVPQNIDTTSPVIDIEIDDHIDNTPVTSAKQNNTPDITKELITLKHTVDAGIQTDLEDINASIGMTSLVEKQCLNNNSDSKMVPQNTKEPITRRSVSLLINTPDKKREIKLKRSTSHQPPASTVNSSESERKQFKWGRKRHTSQQQPNNDQIPSLNKDMNTKSVVSLQTNTLSNEISKLPNRTLNNEISRLPNRALNNEISKLPNIALNKEVSKLPNTAFNVEISRLPNRVLNNEIPKPLNRALNNEIAKPLNRALNNKISKPLNRALNNEIAKPLNRALNNEISKPLNRALNNEISKPLNRALNNEISKPLNRALNNEISKPLNIALNNAISKLPKRALNNQISNLPNRALNINHTLGSIENKISDESIESRESSIYAEPRNSSTQENITIEETSTSGIISNSESNVDADSTYSNSTYSMNQQSNHNGQCNKPMYEVDSITMEQYLRMKCDEWISRFIQIMEEVLSQVLQQDPPFTHSAMPPPWTLHEAALCIATKFCDHEGIKTAANKLSSVLFQVSDAKGKITLNMPPYQYMQMYSYGVHLLAALMEMTTSCEDIQIAVESLNKLLLDIRNPNMESSTNDTLNESKPDDGSVHSDVADISDDSSLHEQEILPDWNHTEKEHKDDSPKKRKPEEELQKPVKFIRNFDVAFPFVKSLSLQRSSTTNKDKSPVQPRDKQNSTHSQIAEGINPNNASKITDDESNSDAPTNEPSIIRKFTKCPELEEKLKIKYNVCVYEKDDCNESYEEYLTDDYYSDDENYNEQRHNTNGNRTDEETDTNEDYEPKSSKDVNSLLCDETSKKFKYVMYMFLQDIRNALKQLQILCNQCYEGLKNPDQSTELKCQLRKMAEIAYLHTIRLCRSLESMLDYEKNNPAHSISDLLEQAGINIRHVDVRLLVLYRTSVENCKNHADQFLSSVRNIISDTHFSAEGREEMVHLLSSELM